MQLKITTDYAIRAVICIASSAGVRSSRDIADSMHIPREYFIQISKTLREQGILQAHPGKNGGYTLARPAEEISLFDIIHAMEGTTRLNRCLEYDAYCSRFASDSCPVRTVYQKVQQTLEEALAGTTIASLIA